MRCCACGLLAGVLAVGFGFAGMPTAATLAQAPASGPQLALAEPQWGTLTGTVVFAGTQVPPAAPLNVDRDQEHCLAKGPLHDQTWIVNPKNKGLKNVVVFLRPKKGEMLPIHPDLKTPKPEKVVLDQPMCLYVPHILVMRADQILHAKNPAPVAHNVSIQGFKNSENVQLPPNSAKDLKVFAEPNPIALSCTQHPWMKTHMWVFDHPYFAVTDANGKFEIQNVPAGEYNVVVWHQGIGYLGGAKGRDGTPTPIKPNAPTDLGTIEIKPAGR